jgi:hypothetical protein
MAGYSDVMKVLAALYGADEVVVRGQLRGRVQNLQKLGIPIGLQVGKGKKIDYKREQIYQIVLCMELAEIGVIPSKISDIIKRWWESILKILRQELKIIRGELPSERWGNDNLLVFKMNQMSAVWGNGGGLDMLSTPESSYLFVTLNQFSNWRHLYFINFSEVVRDVEKQLALVVPQQED